MRVRTKDCFMCGVPKEVLYRCRYKELKDWVFLCGKCLNEVKTLFEGSYQIINPISINSKIILP